MGACAAIPIRLQGELVLSRFRPSQSPQYFEFVQREQVCSRRTSAPSRSGRRAVTKDPLRDPEFLIRRVYAYVAYRVGDGPEAEDITSDVFERALRYRAKYDPAKGEPVQWLIGIARSRIADVSKPPGVELRSEPVDEAGAMSLEQDAVRRIALSQALDSLAARDRELVALRYGADLTARQIADLLGTRTNAVEVALHRALARLREVLTATDA